MDTRKVEAKRLPRNVYRGLENIVGEEWITEDRAMLETYSKYSVDAGGYLKKHRKDPFNIPACVVLPETTEQVQAIVRLANRFRVPFIPFTNGQLGAFSGPSTPEPTLCIHLSRMNRVLHIDEECMTATVEAYADYGQLQAEAMKRGLWNGGTPLATSLCKLSSQTALAGLFQTSLKYGTLSKGIVSVKLVTPTGEILQTGSGAAAGLDNFWEYAPGPDLFSLIRGSGGTTGIITELTVKLHPWAGEEALPEPPAGRPCILDYEKAEYDESPPPKGHRLYWVEFPDLETQITALREVGHAGVGIGLNAAGVYNSYYCSQTQEQTVRRFEEGFFPPWNLYVVTSGVTSEDQLEYEEKVLRQIIEETGGMFLSEDYKPEVLKALAPWNLDCIRHVCGYRMSRYSYQETWFSSGVPEIGFDAHNTWRKAIDTFGETYLTDRGGYDNTPFMYATDRCGRNFVTEGDVYPDPLNPEMLERAQLLMIFSIIDFLSQKIGPGVTGFGISIEPITSLFPEMGPNAFVLFRKFRKIFDPNSVSIPGRQIFTQEELDCLPEELLAGINKLRIMHGMAPIEKLGETSPA